MLGLILDIIGVTTGSLGLFIAVLSYWDKRFIAAKLRRKLLSHNLLQKQKHRVVQNHTVSKKLR